MLPYFLQNWNGSSTTASLKPKSAIEFILFVCVIWQEVGSLHSSADSSVWDSLHRVCLLPRERQQERASGVWARPRILPGDCSSIMGSVFMRIFLHLQLKDKLKQDKEEEEIRCHVFSIFVHHNTAQPKSSTLLCEHCEIMNLTKIISVYETWFEFTAVIQCFSRQIPV